MIQHWALLIVEFNKDFKSSNLSINFNTCSIFSSLFSNCFSMKSFWSGLIFIFQDDLPIKSNSFSVSLKKLFLKPNKIPFGPASIKLILLFKHLFLMTNVWCRLF